MKERIQPRTTTTEVIDILKSVNVDYLLLARLVEHHLINPQRGGIGGRTREWSAEDIFKAYASKILIDEYKERYRTTTVGRSSGMDVRYIAKFITNIGLGGYRKFVVRDDWKKVTEEARKKGIEFNGTQYAYVGKTD